MTYHSEFLLNMLYVANLRSSTFGPSCTGILHRNKVFGSKDKFSSKILLPIAQVNFNFLGIHTTHKLPLQQTKNPEWQVIFKLDMNVESQKLRMTSWLIVNEHLMDCKEYDNNVCSSNIRSRYSSNILLFLLRILLEQTLCNLVFHIIIAKI